MGGIEEKWQVKNVVLDAARSNTAVHRFSCSA